MSEFTFIQISDPHITPTPADRLNGMDTYANFQAITAAIRELGRKIDFILLTGDLARDGEPEAYPRLAELLPDLEAFGVPVLMGIGNHDKRPLFYGTFKKYLRRDAEQPCYYAQRIDGLRVVMLDSSIPGKEPGTIDREQL